MDFPSTPSMWDQPGSCWAHDDPVMGTSQGQRCCACYPVATSKEKPLKG